MVPEVIDWETVRCVSIDARSIRFLQHNSNAEREIVFPSEEALHQALRRWTLESDKATEFFRRNDFKSTGPEFSP